ncbi:MAG: aminotransferase class I/II-fold pyridoxal phosphate-dependent enzyme [Pseudobdellovibrio sp.]
MYLIGEEEIAALRKLFEKKRLYRYQSSYQSECELFENEFSAYVNTAHSLILSSGTNALILSLLAAGIQPGDEVLIPCYTFVATAAAVVNAGAIPVLVNIDDQLSLDLNEAQSKLSSKTKALILVHMDGLVANIPEALDFCKQHKLVFIEDGAQAIGAGFQSQKIGSFGDFGCFSLNENKNISCGEGGILITNNLNHYKTAFSLHDTPAQFSPSKKDFLKEINSVIGFSMRVSEIQGCIMRVQLTRLDYILSELKQRKQIFKSALNKHEKIFKIVEGYSSDECSTSIHLQFVDLEKTNLYAKKLRESGLLFAPVTTRPAHASWKWSQLLGEKAHIQKEYNPYLNTQKKYDYNLSNYLKSVEILTRTVKMDLNLDWSMEETKLMAAKAAEVLTNETL